MLKRVLEDYLILTIMLIWKVIEEFVERIIVHKDYFEWKEMRDKRENHEISDEEYLDWKLNYEIIKNQ